MRKIFTLFAAAATAISASAEVKTVDVTITWPMAKQIDTPQEDGTVKSTYENDLTPVVTAGFADYVTVGEPVLGSELTWGNPRKTTEMIEALIQPVEQVKEATSGHSLSFIVTPKAGFTFKATKLAFLANVIGTGGGNYDLSYKAGGDATTLEENFHPNRNNEDGGYYSTLSYDLTTAATENPFDVTFMIYNLANNKQMGFSNVVITGQLTGDFPETTEPEQPVEPTPGALMSWDFTKWSEATVANLKAGSNWSDIEKADATEPTEASKDNCFWQVSFEEGKNAEGYLTANDVVIEELKGLVYTNEKANRSLAIAVNYPETSLGTYHGPAYLWLGSKEINYFIIPGVPAGATIKMGVESHKLTDPRGVELSVGGEVLKAPDGSEVALPTTYTEQEWLVPATAAATNDVQIYNTNGCHVYFITVTDNSSSAIQTIVSDENAPVEYFNLQGIRVENPANGIFIMRQGNKVSKVRK